MEDTQKLTHLAFLEEQEQQLLEDFFRGRLFDHEKRRRWKKLQAQLYPHIVNESRKPMSQISAEEADRAA